MRPSYKEIYLLKVFSFPSVCHKLSKHQPCKLAILLKVLGVRWLQSDCQGTEVLDVATIIIGI